MTSTGLTFKCLSISAFSQAPVKAPAFLMRLRYTTNRVEKMHIVSTHLGVSATRFITISYVTEFMREGCIKTICCRPWRTCVAQLISPILISHDSVVSKAIACVKRSQIDAVQNVERQVEIDWYSLAMCRLYYKTPLPACLFKKEA